MVRPVDFRARALVLASLWVAVALQILPAQAAPPARFEVCVIGTVHAPWQFRHGGMSPAHIRAALAKVRPDVVGVESCPQWFAQGRFHEVTYEAQGIAVPFARERGLPVYGIDWMDVAAFEAQEATRRRQRAQALQRQVSAGGLPTRMFGEQSPAYLAANSELVAFFRGQDFGFAHVNDVGSDDYGKRYLRGDPEAPDFGGHRNRQIAARCVEVMQEHPGKRLAVVVGAGHKAVLEVLLARVEGVRVLRLGKDVAAPGAAEVAAAERPDDLVLILGHNLDGERSCFHQELIDVPRMRAVIARLRDVPGRVEHAAYFAARLAYLTGDLDAVERHLAQIGDQRPKAALYPFPIDHWRMVYTFDQAIRIARAEVAIAKEEPERAAGILRGLADEIRVPPLPADLDTPGALVQKIEADAATWSTNGPDLRIVRNARFLVPEQVRTPERGMAAVTTQVELASTQLLCLHVKVRARNRARGAVEVYEREPSGAMRTLGTRAFTTGPRWDPLEVGFRVRDPKRPVWVFVYLDAAPGTRFGVKDVEVREDARPAIPAAWIPRTLAREYVRALQRQ